jgi:hypothetical protein
LFGAPETVSKGEYDRQRTHAVSMRGTQIAESWTPL